MKPDKDATIYQPDAGGLVKAWVNGVELDDKAKRQIDALASMPFIHRHVAIMPDAHWGMGATIGSVVPTKGAIIPAAVGVDIGCGMAAVQTTLTANDLPDNLAPIRTALEIGIPNGRTDNGGPNDKGAWQDRPKSADKAFGLMQPALSRIVGKHPKIAKAAERAPDHIGTLGTGNHFVEVCLDLNGHVWIMLHSGSRGIGNRIGSYFIELAKQDMRKWFINVPDVNLSYLVEGTEHFDDYIEAVNWAQDYALANRRHMMKTALQVLAHYVPKPFEIVDEAVECHHNYATKENHFGANVWVTRKGAVSARKGQLGIIPGSMGARSFIVRGKGNKESFCSCSHGAGRVLGRNEAMKKITLEEHAAATAGIECRKDEGVLDESPAAYKDIRAVMAAQSDLVEVVHELRQVVCMKG